MSAFYDRADEIGVRIESLFDPGEVAVVVDRQKDIASEFKKHIGKVRGGVVIVEWQGGTNPDPDTRKPRLTNKYAVTVACKNIIRDAKGQLPADELIQAIANGLHQWNPEALHCMNEVVLKSIIPTGHPQFLIFTLNLEQTFNL